MYKSLSLAFVLIVICFCLIDLTKGQFFAKTSKSIPRMGRRSSLPIQEMPINTNNKLFDDQPVKRNYEFMKSDLYNAFPARYENYQDYLSTLNNADTIEKSNKLIELIQQLNAINNGIN